MQISAKIKPNSFIAEQWQSRGQIGGSVSGVKFNRTPAGAFEALGLTGDQVEALKNNSAVQVDFVTLGIAPPPAAAPEPLPAPDAPVPPPPAAPKPQPDLGAALASSFKPTKHGRPHPKR